MSEEIPIISSLVVFDLLDTAETGQFTREFRSDDFPEFGGPTIAIEIYFGSIGC